MQRFTARFPPVAWLRARFERLARMRAGPVPIGLFLLLPVALALDLFDVGDELVGGPVGIAISFVLQSAFLLALTGQPTYAFAFAGIDLIPFIDVLPFATIVLVREIARSWGRVVAHEPAPDGPVIDV